MRNSRWSVLLYICCLILTTFGGGSCLTQAECVDGSVLSFDGLDDCFAVPFSETFPTEVFTLTAWVRVEAGAPWGGILVRGEDNTSDNLTWSLSTTGKFLGFQLEDAQEIDLVYESQTVVNDGEWHHVAGTRTHDAILTLYVDGTQVAQFSNTLVPSSNNTQTVSIGCYLNNPQGPIGHLKGLIEDVTMWNRALTAHEIGDIFLRPPDSDAPGLVGFWEFDEGSGQVGTDSSPAANNGTLGFSAAPGADDPTWDTCTAAKDLDGDGFRPPEDCNESDPAINPVAVELPGNFVDENCDGSLGDCDPCFAWRNHGEYIRCVSHAVNDLVAAGSIGEEDGDTLVTSAATSDVGKKQFMPSECQ